MLCQPRPDVMLNMTCMVHVRQTICRGSYLKTGKLNGNENLHVVHFTVIEDFMISTLFNCHLGKR
jgi:hypothetical protein